MYPSGSTGLPLFQSSNSKSRTSPCFGLGVVAHHLARADGLPRGDERLRKPLVDREEVVRHAATRPCSPSRASRGSAPPCRCRRPLMRSLAAAAMRTPKLPLRMSKRSVMIPSTGVGQLDRLAYRTPRPAAAARDGVLAVALHLCPQERVFGRGHHQHLAWRGCCPNVASVRATGVLPSMISAICWL